MHRQDHAGAAARLTGTLTGICLLLGVASCTSAPVADGSSNQLTTVCIALQDLWDEHRASSALIGSGPEKLLPAIERTNERARALATAANRSGSREIAAAAREIRIAFETDEMNEWARPFRTINEACTDAGLGVDLGGGP